jgi:hypothetical protein
MLKYFLAQGYNDSRLSKMLFPARWGESSQSGPGLNMVNRAIWRKNHYQEQVAASVTGPQYMRLFVWRYLKPRVYNNLAREIENIQVHMLKDAFLNFQERRELLISASGGHIEKK